MVEGKKSMSPSKHLIPLALLMVELLVLISPIAAAATGEEGGAHSLVVIGFKDLGGRLLASAGRYVAVENGSFVRIVDSLSGKVVAGFVPAAEGMGGSFRAISTGDGFLFVSGGNLTSVLYVSVKGIMQAASLPGMLGAYHGAGGLVLWNSRYIYLPEAVPERLFVDAAQAVSKAVESIPPKKLLSMLGVYEALVEKLASASKGANLSSIEENVALRYVDVNASLVTVYAEKGLALAKVAVVVEASAPLGPHGEPVSVEQRLAFYSLVDVYAGGVAELYRALYGYYRYAPLVYTALTLDNKIVLRQGDGEVVLAATSGAKPVILDSKKGVSVIRIGGSDYVVVDSHVLAILPGAEKAFIASDSSGGIEVVETHGGGSAVKLYRVPGGFVEELATVPGAVIGAYEYHGLVLLYTERGAVLTAPRDIVVPVLFETEPVLNETVIHVHVSYGDLVYTVEVSPGKALLLPLGASISVDAEALGATGHAEAVIDKPSTIRIHLSIPTPLGEGPETYLPRALVSPFKHGVIAVNESSVPLKRLPGADGVVAGAGIIVLYKDRSLKAFTPEGRLVWAKELPAKISSAKMVAGLLMVVADRLYVVDPVTGGVIAVSRVSPVQMFDYDPYTSTVLAVSGDRLELFNPADTLSHRILMLKGLKAAAVYRGVLYTVSVRQGKIVLEEYTATGARLGAWRINADRVENFLTVGYFKAFGFRRPGYGVTVLVTPGGLLEVNGSPVALAYLGNRVSVPVRVPGDQLALLVVKYKGYRMYAVGQGKAAEIASFTCAGDIVFAGEGTVIAVQGRDKSSGRDIIVYDYFGEPHLVLHTSLDIVTGADVVDGVLVYSGLRKSFILPDIYGLGRYDIGVTVLDETGRPVDATVRIEPLNVSVHVKGSAYFTVASEGRYTLVASAPYMETASAVATVNDTAPVAHVTLVLKHKIYGLHVKAVDDKGRPVLSAIVVADGKEAKVVNGEAVLRLVHGKYTVSLKSRYYENVSTTVYIPDNSSVVLKTKLVRVPLRIMVVGEDGKPIQGAQILFRAKNLPPSGIKAVSDENGYANITLPVGTDATATIQAHGYRASTIHVKATYDTFGKVFKVVLEKFRAKATVKVVSKNKPVEGAVVRIRDIHGRIVATSSTGKDGVARITLTPGVYRVYVETKWARATKALTVSEKTPAPLVVVELPPPPTPLWKRVVVIGIVAAVVAGVALAVYRFRLIKKEAVSEEEL